LARTQISRDHIVAAHPQLFALGFNVGGRPDGLWLSRGSSWLSRAKSLENPRFPLCCNFYRVELSPNARILRVSSDAEFAALDAQFPSYWLNLDYFDVEFTDQLTGRIVASPRSRILNLRTLCRRPGESLFDTLINNKIIFADEASARAGCTYYSQTDPDMVARFKYKNWAAVADQYDGVIFDNWESMSEAMRYFWFQSLDVSSACIWNTQCIDRLALLYQRDQPHEQEDSDTEPWLQVAGP
jgi:hypothetical protein